MRERILSKLLSKDIFGKLKRKPWWEKIRAGILFLLFGLSGYLLFDIGPTLSIHCVPANHAVVLNDQQTEKAEADCLGILSHWLKLLPTENADKPITLSRIEK